jgi:hypothetical protein
MQAPRLSAAPVVVATSGASAARSPGCTPAVVLENWAPLRCLMAPPVPPSAGYGFRLSVAWPLYVAARLGIAWPLFTRYPCVTARLVLASATGLEKIEIRTDIRHIARVQIGSLMGPRSGHADHPPACRVQETERRSGAHDSVVTGTPNRTKPTRLTTSRCVRDLERHIAGGRLASREQVDGADPGTGAQAPVIRAFHVCAPTTPSWVRPY